MNDMRYDVAVVGAGQAGLAIGHALAEQKKRFVILEAADSVGSAWRDRWDSLVLFTPRRYDALPGLAFPGDPDGYPTRDEVACLPRAVRGAVRVAGRALDAGALVEQGRGRLRARRERHGRFAPTRWSSRRGRSRRRSCLPSLAALAADVFQTHSVGYRRPADLPEGRVLVVGGGNTGFQIAKELAGSREVHLAIGSRQTPAAAAAARPRPLLVADEARAALEDRRLADRPARAGPRHPDRVEPARR